MDIRRIDFDRGNLDLERKNIDVDGGNIDSDRTNIDLIRERIGRDRRGGIEPRKRDGYRRSRQEMGFDQNLLGSAPGLLCERSPQFRSWEQ